MKRTAGVTKSQSSLAVSSKGGCREIILLGSEVTKQFVVIFENSRGVWLVLSTGFIGRVSPVNVYNTQGYFTE